jgi:hypothetical protein
VPTHTAGEVLEHDECPSTVDLAPHVTSALGVLEILCPSESLPSLHDAAARARRPDPDSNDEPDQPEYAEAQ